MQLALYSSAVDELRGAVIDALRPKPNQKVYEWMEETCSVRGEYEGKYSSALTPYVREPLECFADKRIEDLVLCYATQTAKTTVVMGGVAYRLCEDPSDALWVMPDKDFGGSFSKRRWQPFVEDCAPLQKLIPEGSARRTFFTTHEQQFGRSVLYFVGSNSPTQVAGRSCGLVIMDETDKFGIRNDKEAGALENAEERTKTFNYPLIVKTSTPTTEHGQIWRNFLLGDQRYYFVTCPHCRKMIQLVWKQVKWWRKSPDESMTGAEWDLAKVRANTFYQCQEEGCEIRDSSKTVMLREGEWRPTVTTNAPNRRSYHLNSLYAPWKKTQWPLLATAWLESKAGGLDARQKFINSTLAECWDMNKAFDEEEARTAAYVVAEIQRDRTPILTVDVQEGTSHFWAVARTWAASGESWLLWAGRCESLTEVEHLQGEYAVHPNNVILDIAHMTNTVCQWLVDRDWRGAWGSDAKAFAHRLNSGSVIERIVSAPKLRDPHLGTVRQSDRNPMAIYVQWAKNAIMDQLAIRRVADNPPVWHVHGDAPEEYFKHMNSYKKVMVQNKRTGRYDNYWKQFYKHDHLLSCECMQIVGAMQSEIITEDFQQFAGTQTLLRIQDMKN